MEHSRAEIALHPELGLTWWGRDQREEELDVSRRIGFVERFCARVSDVVNVHHLDIRVHPQ